MSSIPSVSLTSMRESDLDREPQRQDIVHRPIIYGMNNPLSSDKRLALYPFPRTSAGGRLYNMLRDVAPDIGRGDYIRVFDRRNLVDNKEWHPAQARLTATTCKKTLEDRTVLLLGGQVRSAFDLEKNLLHPVVDDCGATFRQIPHPSGRNLWYNQPENRLMVGLLLEELYRRYEG